MSAADGVQNDDGIFLRPTLDEIVDRKQDLAEEHFGADVDLSQGSPIKQIIDVVAAEHEHIWQVMEDTYYSAYYNHAYGDQLEKLLAIAGVRRRPRRGATGIVNFTTHTVNDTDVLIPEGTRVATESTDERPSIPFRTTEPARLPAGQNTVNAVPIRAVDPDETELDTRWLGEETNVAAGTIVKFETPIPGVDRVRNPYPTGAASREEGYSFIEGRDRETDKELRDRFERKFGDEAFSTLDAIRTHLLEQNGVLNVGMEENVSMEDYTDSGGLPPKSFRATVLGDAPNNEIAQAIFDRRPAGIQSYGPASGLAVDTDNNDRQERWRWANEVYVYLDINVTHDDDYPSDGNLEVENRLVEMIGGETVAGEEYVGLGMGEDVIYDMVHSEVMSVDGVWRVDVQMGTAAEDLAPEDIEVPEEYTALTSYEDVNVFNSEESRP